MLLKVMAEPECEQPGGREVELTVFTVAVLALSALAAAALHSSLVLTRLGTLVDGERDACRV